MSKRCKSFEDMFNTALIAPPRRKKAKVPKPMFPSPEAKAARPGMPQIKDWATDEPDRIIVTLANGYAFEPNPCELNALHVRGFGTATEADYGCRIKRIETCDCARCRGVHPCDCDSCTKRI